MTRWRLPAAAVALVAYTAAWLTPATWWFEPLTLTVSQREPGGPAIVAMGRLSKRAFDGAYTTAVFAVGPDAPPVCGRGETRRYKGGLSAPYEMPLAEWANDARCAALPPGSYYAHGCWTVLRPWWGLVPDKTACIVSPIFEILPREGDE